MKLSQLKTILNSIDDGDKRLSNEVVLEVLCPIDNSMSNYSIFQILFKKEEKQFVLRSLEYGKRHTLTDEILN